MEQQKDIIEICDDLFYTIGLVGIRNLSHDLKEMDKQIALEDEEGIEQEDDMTAEEEQVEEM